MKYSREDHLNQFIQEKNLPINVKWLDLASTHRSYQNSPQNILNNEKLENLGDSVLDLVAIDWLYDNNPQGKEGDYTKLRSEIVCDENLFKVGKRLELSNIMQLDKGTSLTEKILADCVEALFGGIFKQHEENSQKGYNVVKDFFPLYFQITLETIRSRNFKPLEEGRNQFNPKNELLEYLAKNKLPKSQKLLLNETGPDHDKRFISQYSIELNRKKISSTGLGKTKRESEMKAAQKLLEEIKKLVF
jgi:ribonuclease-3